MDRDERLDGAILAAYFIPVVGNILYRPVLGMQQTLVFVAGLAMAINSPAIFQATGWVVMAGAWIWSLATLETAYHARRPRRHA